MIDIDYGSVYSQVLQGIKILERGVREGSDLAMDMMDQLMNYLDEPIAAGKLERQDPDGGLTFDNVILRSTES